MNYQEAIITHHAERRAKERLGLPKKAVQKLARDALDHGFKRESFTGSLRRYLDKVYHSKGSSPSIIVKGLYLFIFYGETFITAWVLPSKYNKAALKTQKQESQNV